MEELKQHKFALSIIGLLVLIRFAIVPLLDWQDALVDEISLLKNKSGRIENVLAGKEQLNQYHSRLQDYVERTDTLFLKVENETSFQLSQQQWLEQKLKSHDLTMDNIGWLPTQQLEGIDAQSYGVQLNLKGKTVDVIRFLQELQSQPNYIAVQAFNLGLRFQSTGNLGTSQVRLNLRFHGRMQVVS